MTMEPLMTCAEVAEMVQVTPTTVYRWFESGKLPGFKVNDKAVRFRRDEVEAWLENGRTAPAQEPQNGSGAPARVKTTADTSGALIGPDGTRWTSFHELRRRVAERQAITPSSDCAPASSEDDSR